MDLPDIDDWQHYQGCYEEDDSNGSCQQSNIVVNSFRNHRAGGSLRDVKRVLRIVELHVLNLDKYDTILIPY